MKRGERLATRRSAGVVALLEPPRWRWGLGEEAVRVRRPRAVHPCVQRSAFAGFRFPSEVITVAVRWYLRYGLSYRDVEELLAERGVEVDHVIPRTPWPFAGVTTRPRHPGPQVVQ